LSPTHIGMVADHRPARTGPFTSYARSAASAWISARESGDKLTRFGPFSSQCRADNVKIRRGAWNEELFRVLEGFPDFGKHSLRLRASSKRVSRVPTSASHSRPLPLRPSRSHANIVPVRRIPVCAPSRISRCRHRGSSDPALEELGRLDTPSAADLAQQVADDRNNPVGKRNPRCNLDAA